MDSFLIMILLGGGGSVFLALTLVQIYNYYKPIPLDLGKVLGYTSYFSYNIGDDVHVYSHHENYVSVTLFRLGKSKEKIKYLGIISPFVQSNAYDIKEGLVWTQTFSFNSKNIKSGYYILELIDQKTADIFQIPLIIKPNTKRKVAVVGSTNTWMAYNEFGGRSNYRDYVTPKIVKAYLDLTRADKPLPYARPMVSNQDIIEGEPGTVFGSHLLRSEWEMAAFLDEKKIDYGVFSDKDMEDDPILLDSDVIIFNTHSEYWSNKMIHRYKQYLNAGGKVIFASGNNVFRKVRLDGKAMSVISQNIKETHIADLVGTTLVGDGNAAPYKVMDKTHWIFDGLSVKNGQEFGIKNLNQVDGMSGQGASGWEVDSLSKYSDGFKCLAKGLNPKNGADMVIKENLPGWVFNASSITFVGSLNVDEVISKIMINLISQAISQ